MPLTWAATQRVRAINISRGMIEFRADAATPCHEPACRKDRHIILFCASGGRPALAGKVLKEMGYGKVQNVGAFREAGIETGTA